MSHPVKLIDYACGHSTPVRGSTGGHVNRKCADCILSSNGATQWRWFTRKDPITLSDMLGPNPHKENPND